MEYEAAYKSRHDGPRKLFYTAQLKTFESNGQRDEIVSHAKRLAPYGKRLVSIAIDTGVVWTEADGWLPERET